METDRRGAERAARGADFTAERRALDPARRVAALAFFLAGLRREFRARVTRLDFAIVADTGLLAQRQ